MSDLKDKKGKMAKKMEFSYTKNHRSPSLMRELKKELKEKLRSK